MSGACLTNTERDADYKSIDSRANRDPNDSRSNGNADDDSGYRHACHGRKLDPDSVRSNADADGGSG